MKGTTSVNATETFTLSPFDSATMIESIDAYGHGLRVAFERRGDRMGHVIAAVTSRGSSNETVMPLLASIEGDSSQLWPPSAPLQSLSIERRIASEVALLVGMAGKSHWSASVEAIEGERRIEFDLACRVGGTAERLGSRYRWLCEVNQITGSSCLLDCRIGKGRLRILPEMSIAASREGQLTIDPGELKGRGPARWQYWLEWLAE
jgi:hypothetical protein